MTSKDITESRAQDQAALAVKEKEGIRPMSLFRPRRERTISDHARNYTLEALALSFWLYTLLKIFVFDFDALILHTFFPDYEWFLDFRLIFILALACGVWFWVGTRDAIVWFLYIAFYPVWLMLIRVPFFVIKQKSWVLAVGLFNAIASFFKNLRYRLSFVTIFLSSFAIIVFSDIDNLIMAAAGVLVLLILVTYVKSFINALKPSTIFQIYSKFLGAARNVSHSTFSVADELRNIPVDIMDKPQLEKWHTSLQQSVLFNRLCLFVATKLRDYQRSEWRIISINYLITIQ